MTHSPETKRRRLQFRLRTLMLVTAGCAGLFSLWIAYVTPFLSQRKLLARHTGQANRLVFKEAFLDQTGTPLRVFLFEARQQGFPGSQPQQIVITDHDFQERVAWTADYPEEIMRVTASAPIVHSAALEFVDGAPILAMTCLHRGGGYGTYRYSLSATGVQRIGEVEWDPRLEAELDWRNKHADIYGHAISFAGGDTYFRHEFDEDNGLRLRGDLEGAYAKEYTQRVRELIAQNGLPPWSVKRKYKVYRVAEPDYVAVLDSAALEEVRKTPYQINDRITIANGNVSTSVYPSGFAVLPNGQQMGEKPDRIFVGQLGKYPDVTFVRAHFPSTRQTWVGAFAPDGTQLGSVSRFARSRAN